MCIRDRLLAPYDAEPTVIVSEGGKEQIKQCLLKNNIQAQLVLQSMPRGMGDAVLCIDNSEEFTNSEHVLLVWGDIPFIKQETVETMINHHLEQDSDFTFVSRVVDKALSLIHI